MKKPAWRVLSSVPALLAALVCASANNTYAALNFWDPTGTTPSQTPNGNWEDNAWAPTVTPTASPAAWADGVAAAFSVAGMGSNNFTVTVNANHNIAGLFNGAATGSGSSLGIIIQGPGILSITNVPSVVQGFGTQNSTNNTIVRCQLSGPGGIQNQNNGSLYLSGTNTFSGGTSLGTSAGLNFNNGSAFGTGAITNSVTTTVLATPATDSAGGTFATAAINVTNTVQMYGGTASLIYVGIAAAPTTFSGPWSLPGAAGTTATLQNQPSGTTVTISGPVSGAANFTKTGAGTLVLSGPSTYSGITTVNNGILSVTSINKVTGGSTTSALGHPTTSANGTINLGSTTTGVTFIYTGTGETSDRVINLAGTTGGATLEQDGSGALTLSTAFTATGAGSKTLTLQGSSTAANTISGAIVNNSAANITSLTKSGAGAWVLSGPNTFSGKTTVGNGSLSVASLNKVTGGTASSSLGAPTSAANGTIALGATTTAGKLIYTGTGETTDRVIDLAGTTGGGTFENDGSGAVTFTSAFTATGAGNKSLTLQGTSTAANTVSAAIVDHSGNTTALIKAQAGNWTLSGANTFSGNMTISGGTLTIGGSGSLKSGTAASYTNAINDTASLVYASSANQTLSGVISGSGGQVTQNGSGTLTLLATNTYTGATTINGGTLALGASGLLANGSSITIAAGGTFDVSGHATYSLGTSATLTATGVGIGGTAATIFGASGGTVSLGTRPIALTYTPTSFTGDATHPSLYISQGTLAITNNSFSINNAGGSPLGIGTYAIIQQASGNVAASGLYTVVVSGGGITAGNTAYISVSGGTVNLIVAPTGALSNLTASQSITYGSNSITLSGTVSGAGPVYPNLGDTVTITINGNAQSTTISDATGDFSINYNPSTIPASGSTYSINYFYPGGGTTLSPASDSSTTLTVNKAPLSITASNQTKVYGQTLTFGSGSTQFSAVGLQNGQTVGSVTLAVTGNGGAVNAPVSGSPYTITPSAATGGTFNANNYTLTYNTGTLTITPASLTVTATGLLTYGDDPTNAMYFPQYAPLQGTDTVAVITGSADFSTDATATNYVGTNYLAHVADTGTLTAANYTFVAGPDGILTITNRPLTVTNVVANDKVYDTTPAATLDFSGAGLDGLVNGDDASVSLVTSNAVGVFANKNVGNGKTVTISGLFTTGDLGTNYSLIQPTATANITKAPLVVSATGVDKIYDSTTNATVNLSATPLGSDSVTPNYTSASFADKNVNTGVVVTVTGIFLTGPDAGNYAPNTSATTSANITSRLLTVNATGVDKVYDGTTNATVTLSDNKVPGDAVTDNYAAASFADKNVNTGVAVSVSGISISGADAGNYTLANTTASTSANITVASLTVTAHGVNKVYDGTTNATVTLSDNRVPGDNLTDSYTSASFADKNVNTGIAVSVSGIGISGPDSGNYSLANTTASTSADITSAGLTVAGITANDKVYDATTNATLVVSNAVLIGVAGSDDVSLSTTNAAGSFADKNVGTNKVVTIAGLQIYGADATNYTLTQPTTNASITPASLTVSATGVNKVYDGTTNATVTLSDNKVAGDAVTDSYTSASFADKNVNTGIAVSVSGISISGADASNYTLANTTASTTADITARSLTVTAAGVNKIYDGTTAATVTLSDNKLPGDTVTDSYTSAAFADPNVATGIAVSVGGISISGADAGNYSLANTTASTAADITAAATSTLLVSSVNPSGSTSNVTFTATVTYGAGNAAGNVVFLANGTPFSTNALAGGMAAASTTSLPVGTNTIAAQFATQGNFLASSASLDQVVTNSIIYSTTNTILSIVSNNDGTYMLNLQGTPGASYYVVAGTNVTVATSSWTPVTGSTNTAPGPSGLWSLTVSNPPPAFYRSVAVNPAP